MDEMDAGRVQGRCTFLSYMAFYGDEPSPPLLAQFLERTLPEAGPGFKLTRFG